MPCPNGIKDCQDCIHPEACGDMGSSVQFPDGGQKVDNFYVELVAHRIIVGGPIDSVPEGILAQGWNLVTESGYMPKH